MVKIGQDSLVVAALLESVSASWKVTIYYINRALLILKWKPLYVTIHNLTVVILHKRLEKTSRAALLIRACFFVQYVLCTFCTRSTQCTWLLLKIRAQNLISYIPLWKIFIACTWKLSISLNTSIKGNWNKCESSK